MPPHSNDADQSFAIGRRGFLRAAAAVTGTAALTPLTAAEAAAVPSDKPAPINALPPSAVSLVNVNDGSVKAALAKLDGIIQDVRRRTNVPGLAVAVVHNDQVKFHQGYGIRDLKLGGNVTEDTVFQLASVSKPLAATAVARAVGRKQLNWTDPIVKYLPEFALSDPYVTSHVTVQDMLSHRSGLPGAAGDLLEDLGYPQPFVLERLRLEPLTPFRTLYAYANFGYTAGANAAAAAAGQSWDDFAAATLFGPLGMTQASFSHRDFLNRDNRTAMHVRVGGFWEQLYQRNADPQAPAGGASASVTDLALWLRLQLADGVWAGQPFVDSAALRWTHTPQILLSRPANAYARSGFYGLGMDISDDAAGRVRWSHSGAFFQGASTAVLMLPSANLGIAVLTNGMPIGVPEAIGAYFLDYVEAGKITRDWLTGYGGLFAQLMKNTSVLAPPNKPPANPTPPQPNAFYTGVYQNSYYGGITIQDVGGTLHLRIGPQGRQDFVLSHWDGNVFAFSPTGENALGITAATFSPKPAGTQAASVTLEYYNADGLGVFTR
jgi:CubicO group peptidase (beta-lactamase class C family)